MFLSVFRFLDFSSTNNLLSNNRFVPKVKLTQPLNNEATVTREIAPHKIGQVQFHASWWRARCELNVTIPEGEIVRVIGYFDTTVLLVEPIPRVDLAYNPIFLLYFLEVRINWGRIALQLAYYCLGLP